MLRQRYLHALSAFVLVFSVGCSDTEEPPPRSPFFDRAGVGTLPVTGDYAAHGPFSVRVVNDTGPDGDYTIFRPTSLGTLNGQPFKHPIATWGNGTSTVPALHAELLSTIASHGIVVIASNSTTVTKQLMTEGLDWMIAQGSVRGDYQGKLDPSRCASIGYSLGGAGAVDAGSHPNVIATVSMHGLTGNSNLLHGPLLLFAGGDDSFVSGPGFVTPTFNRSSVQTFYATLTGADHLYPLGDAGDERAPTVAWLRLWLFGDQGARPYFYGDDCRLCDSPWVNPQRKNWR